MGILKEFAYVAPAGLKDALKCLRSGGRVLAGGTILINVLKKGGRPPKSVVSLRRIPGLSGVRETRGGLAVGAMTTLAELEASEAVRRRAPVLAEAVRSIATTPVRHRATIGGNVACRYFWADLPAVLIAGEARAAVLTTRGVKRMTVEDYLEKDAGCHILLRLEVPCPGGRGFIRRHTRASEVDLPVLIVAGRVKERAGAVESVRICVNTTTSRPFLLSAVGSLLKDGAAPAEAAWAAALESDLSGRKIDAVKRQWLTEDIRGFLAQMRVP